MAEAKPRVRKFLVVVDKTPECRVALRYAARRAQHTTGRVTLLAISSPPDFQQWRGVESIMEDEAHAEAEALVHAAAKTVNELAGLIPAAGTGKAGPGPLVSMFATGSHAIPVTIVPGTLTDAAIDAIA